ncbi:MAG: hypothetical protein AAGM84_13715 [Pseudomonadota bacterium]
MRRYLVLLPVLLLPTLSFGNENLKTLASGLGISQGQARTCLEAHVTPVQQPTQAQRRAVYVCFKSHNPELTPSQVRAAMAAVQP